LATERLTAVEHPYTLARTLERKAIDIIVPVYKSVHLTTRCLNSLADQIQEIASSNPRLIVINDSPGEPDVLRMLEAFANRHSYVTVLENERNLGFVKSVNKGLEIACKAGRDVILVNADTETYPDTLKNLVDAAYSDPQIGFASPRSNNASFCSLPHFYGGVVANQAEAYKRWQVLSRTMPPFHFVPTAVGFYLYIKNEVIANFGFLDTEFGVGYEEENDLILRANKAGYRAVLVNNSFAYHAGSASFNLLDMNLRAHQGANLQKMANRHPEYLPLVRRYEASAHFRAETLLSQVLPAASGRVKIVFDLSAVGPHFNGTNEMSVAIIDSFYERHASTFEIDVICSQDAFEFHKLDRHEGLRRHDADLQTLERFAVGVQLGQPFSVHAISVLEDLAVVNIFGMLDTIAEDCGYLSITHRLEVLWGHIARHANGLFFNSRFSEGSVLARYPDAKQLSKYARLLPTKLSCYKKASKGEAAEHVLIMGNHFAHKASNAAAEILKAAFPTTQFVVLGTQNQVSRNVRTYRSGTLSDTQMESLYTRASVVVLPSHVEGFGLGLLHALAARKVVIARDIPATREILSTYQRTSGVFLYRDDANIVPALKLAMNERASLVDDEGAETWDDWVDGFARFCLKLLAQDDLFERVVRRIQAGDMLRKADMFERYQATSPATMADASSVADNAKADTITDSHGRRWLPAGHVKELLHLDGEEFVNRTYVTLFRRLPDSDGLVNYLTELRSGVSKLEILSRLRKSTEGRKYAHPLIGYRSIVMRTRVRSLMGLAA
jgi:GT2 family glycosyltransferase/glycosyltransferase involved in cell wall biosynthesis